MSLIHKINSSRFSLKEILSNEWDTSQIPDYSNEEIERLYVLPSAQLSPIPGVAAACNISISHKFIPSHRLHIIYYNFPENGKKSSKVTRSACDKLYEYLKYDKEINKEDSIFIIINDTISESLEKSFDELNIKLQNDLEREDISDEIQKEMKKNNFQLEKKHFCNIHLFNIDNFISNIFKHRLVPKQEVIRKKEEINLILKESNSKLNQLPIILKKDIISKMLRLTNGDICKITRKSDKCGEYYFYRVCK